MYERCELGKIICAFCGTSEGEKFCGMANGETRVNKLKECPCEKNHKCPKCRIVRKTSNLSRKALKTQNKGKSTRTVINENDFSF